VIQSTDVEAGRWKLFCLVAAVSLLASGAYSCASQRGPTEDFGLGVKFREKLSPSEMEERLRAVDPSVVAVPAEAQLKSYPGLPTLGMVSHEFVLSGVHISYGTYKDAVRMILATPYIEVCDRESPQWAHIMVQKARELQPRNSPLKTLKGITLGSTGAEVERAYGTPINPHDEANMEGMPGKGYAYDCGSYSIVFLVSDGVVVEISGSS
jgi:hypothetical protein